MVKKKVMESCLRGGKRAMLLRGAMSARLAVGQRFTDRRPQQRRWNTMKQSIAVWAAWASLITATTAALGAAPDLPRVFCLSPQDLAQAKALAAAKNEALRPALEKLRREAKSALKAGPFTVVDNDLVPPSDDKHDYISFGPYWWPDPAKKDGLPYVRRDGEVYPGSRSGGSDSPALGQMTSAVHTLALAYYLLGDDPGGSAVGSLPVPCPTDRIAGRIRGRMVRTRCGFHSISTIR